MTAGLVFGSKVINAALGVVMSILIARSLGPADRGAYFLALTIAVGAFSLGNLSLDSSMFWAVARRAANVGRLWRTVAPLAMVGLGVAAALYVLAWFAGLLDEVPRETVVAGLAVIPVTLGRYLVDGVLYVKSRARMASLALIT